MAMSEFALTGMILPFVVGLAVGAFFFGGLYWTVRRLATARYPAALSLASMLLRLGVSLAAMYLVMAGDWRRLTAAVVGMIFMRLVLVRLLRPAGRGA
ncbi:MAG: ATP synthase subunit I [Desulfarculus sp.]|nr:ATP synthase subunit I [Pseudomonadota bacterium]MBV1714350.1 ATP synthase subunit I [Desulfarculus sp.]MBU4576736.1 ATP synthase subunit I [Pseudomonadota bacterium]MBU4597159.1 ATP synthase subunit I [Pseudomonadota bacterium]MBV1738206.1 ATP synthase subunit I [Desulfarculus sp.]